VTREAAALEATERPICYCFQEAATPVTRPREQQSSGRDVCVLYITERCISHGRFLIEEYRKKLARHDDLMRALEQI
jgi:hypothetical protein